MDYKDKELKNRIYWIREVDLGLTRRIYTSQGLQTRAVRIRRKVTWIYGLGKKIMDKYMDLGCKERRGFGGECVMDVRGNKMDEVDEV